MSNLKKVILIQTDITTFAVQAIVNSANKSLLGGSGLDYIIHKKAGPLMKTECIQLHQEKGGCSTGQAVNYCFQIFYCGWLPLND